MLGARLGAQGARGTCVGRARLGAQGAHGACVGRAGGSWVKQALGAGRAGTLQASGRAAGERARCRRAGRAAGERARCRRAGRAAGAVGEARGRQGTNARGRAAGAGALGRRARGRHARGARGARRGRAGRAWCTGWASLGLMQPVWVLTWVFDSVVFLSHRLDSVHEHCSLQKIF